MEKSKDSAIVSVKHMSRVLFISLMMMGCSRSVQMSAREAGEQWYSRYAYCEEMGMNSKADFPVNPWFNALSFEEKKSVIGYIYNFNMDLCTKDELKKLEAALASDSDEKAHFRYDNIVEPLDERFAERMKGIDKSEVLKIQQVFSKPFSIRHVATTLDLYRK